MKARTQLRCVLGLLAATFCGYAGLRVDVSWTGPKSGRVLLILAKQGPLEPRFQVSELLTTQQVFGVDGRRGTATFDSTTLGYPVRSLDEVPAGDYFVQAVLNVYETFARADGHTVQLPMDQGEGQRWSGKPGNLYSEAVRLHLDPKSSAPVKLALTRTVPQIDAPADTRYVRHVRIESKLLSAFWGRPMYLGAVVAVPEGFDDHPEARYPVMYYQGHFARTFTAFRNQAPPSLARMLIVQTQDANPYGDNSYAVNSANLGPYGDALVQELYPYVEQKFRAIGQPWSRAVYGGSTGGWRALALQVFHPEFFNGAWMVTPDPVDFHAYSLVNLYEDENAFYSGDGWKRTPVPMMHDPEGRIEATMEDAIRLEEVVGTRGRSAEQFDLWQAVFSPVARDGYPAPIFNPRTGAIDHTVAEYWKRHFDLTDVMRRDWPSLGPQLVGKLHFTTGLSDAFYLDRAVRLAERFLESTKEPNYGGTFEYSASAGHGSAMTAPRGPALSLHQRVMAAMLERILKTAPAGADLTSWR